MSLPYSPSSSSKLISHGFKNEGYLYVAEQALGCQSPVLVSHPSQLTAWVQCLDVVVP